MLNWPWCGESKALKAIKSQLNKIEYKVNIGMSNLEDANASLDAAHAGLEDLAGDAQALATLAAELQAQVDAGGADTALAAQVAAKAAAFAERIATIDAGLEAATGVVTPAPVVDPVDPDAPVVEGTRPPVGGFKPAGAK